MLNYIRQHNVLSCDRCEVTY